MIYRNYLALIMVLGIISLEPAMALEIGEGNQNNAEKIRFETNIEKNISNTSIFNKKNLLNIQKSAVFKSKTPIFMKKTLNKSAKIIPKTKMYYNKLSGSRAKQLIRQNNHHNINSMDNERKSNHITNNSSQITSQISNNINEELGIKEIMINNSSTNNNESSEEEKGNTNQLINQSPENNSTGNSSFNNTSNNTNITSEIDFNNTTTNNNSSTNSSLGNNNTTNTTVLSSNSEESTKDKVTDTLLAVGYATAAIAAACAMNPEPLVSKVVCAVAVTVAVVSFVAVIFVKWFW